MKIELTNSSIFILLLPKTPNINDIKLIYEKLKYLGYDKENQALKTQIKIRTNFHKNIEKD